MADSIVDLGAAAVDYVGDKISDAFDYMTGAPEASASGGYYKSLGPGARQYFSGPGEEDSESFFEYLGFEDGGVAIPQEDMDDFVDFIQRNRPSYKEGETTAYKDFGGMLGMQPPLNQPPRKDPLQEGRGIGIGSLVSVIRNGTPTKN